MSSKSRPELPQKKIETQDTNAPLPKGVSRDGRNMERLNVLERFARLCVRGVSRLPLRLLYVFSDATYLLMYHVLGYRLGVVRKNLRAAFPQKDAKELRQIERRFYLHLSDYFFETIKGLTMTDEELRRRMNIRNPELVADLVDRGRTVFLYAGHTGNWEWFNIVPLLMPGKDIHAFYQRQGNRLANYISVEVRTRRGIAAVESHHGFRYTYECIRSGVPSVTLVVGDQSPHRGAQKQWIQFFGQDTPFLVGPEHIARKLDIALVYPSFVGYRRGHYDVEFRTIAEHPGELPDGECASRFAAYLEDDLNRLPHLWLWSHNRWKHKHKDFPDDK